MFFYQRRVKGSSSEIAKEFQREREDFFAGKTSSGKQRVQRRQGQSGMSRFNTCLLFLLSHRPAMDILMLEVTVYYLKKMM